VLSIALALGSRAIKWP